MAGGLRHDVPMCGRFAVTTDPARLAEEIDALNETGLRAAAPNYNVAPTTDIAVVVARHDVSDDQRAAAQRPALTTPPTRRIRLMRWGLLPSWVKAGPDGAPQPKNLLINARAESVTTSPAYRSAASHRRCLIPMDGYYEWRPADDPKRGRKTPFYFSRPDGRPLLVAGLWSVWRPGPQADPMLSCTVITTDAVGEFAEVHDRMPLVLAAADWDRWLDPDATAPADLLAGAPAVGPMTMRAVSTLVNNVTNNGPELIEPAGGGDQFTAGGNQPVGLF